MQLNVDDSEGRADAEMLLTHMCTVGSQEWIVVLATLLRRIEVGFIYGLEFFLGLSSKLAFCSNFCRSCRVHLVFAKVSSLFFYREGGFLQVLVETFQGDPRLWQAYSHTLQVNELFAIPLHKRVVRCKCNI